MEYNTPDSYMNPSPVSNENRRRTKNISSKSAKAKQIFPKKQNAFNKAVTSTLHSNNGKRSQKRKITSTQDSESDDNLNQIIPAPNGKQKTGKLNKKSKFTPNSNHINNFNFNTTDSKIGVMINKKNECNESIQKNSKCSTQLADIDDNSSSRNTFPFIANQNLTAKIGSITEGKILFSSLIKPIKLPKFMAKYWERRPLHIKRDQQEFYKILISTEQIDKMLRENHVEFTKNIDITQYKDGVRETLNPVGRAMPPSVWRKYEEGCSIRILNPQTFLPAMHSLNATLQEYFQCMVGANVYLTPPNSQGFAPHYDDIEAFVLQIEGKKHWRVYSPQNRQETLPRESSKNFKQKEIGKPCLDVVLEAGDFLYFPRGYIHQAITVEDCHSLHITVSVYQKQTYGDLLEKLIPMALQKAITEDVSLRSGVPLNMWQCLGAVHSDNAEREAIITRIKTCVDTVCRYIKNDTNIDDAVDLMALKYQHDALPPILTAEEEERSVYKTKTTVPINGEINSPFIEMNTYIRLIRANVLRMVRYGDISRVYYSSENSKEYHEFEENFLEIESTDAKAISLLVKSYPNFITPAQLQLENDDKNLTVAQDLWERGILMTAEPLT